MIECHRMRTAWSFAPSSLIYPGINVVPAAQGEQLFLLTEDSGMELPIYGELGQAAVRRQLGLSGPRRRGCGNSPRSAKIKWRNASPRSGR